MAFKMKGHSLPGPNQRKSPAKHFEGLVHDHPHASGKKKTSKAMKRKIAEVKDANLKETNALLVAQGKDPVKAAPAKHTATFGENTTHEAIENVQKHNKAHQEGVPADHKKGLVKSNKVYRPGNKEDRKSESPAKCPLLAAIPAVMGAIGSLKKKKE